MWPRLCTVIVAHCPCFSVCRFSVQTIAQVSVTKWRPKPPGGGQICELVTAASTGFDLSVHIWDVFRPHIPIYSTKVWLKAGAGVLQGHATWMHRTIALWCVACRQ